MRGYKTTYEGGQGEIVEKKSRFIATVAPVSSEEEALEFINGIKKKYWDATHNCAAFVVGRFFLRDSLKPLAEKNPYLKKLLFEQNSNSETVVLMITRLVPLFPYNLQNFAYGITDIHFWKYTICTFVFMLPGVSFFTIGAAGITATEGRVWYFVAAGVLFVLVMLLGIAVKRHYLGKDAGKKERGDKVS